MVRSEKGTGTMRTSPQSNMIPALIVLVVPEGKILLGHETKFININPKNSSFRVEGKTFYDMVRKG